MSNDWLNKYGHVLGAIAIMALFTPVVLFTGSPWYGFVAVTFGYYFREKAQWEAKEKKRLGLDSVIPLTFKGLSPFSWSKEQRLDFFYPVVTALLISMVVYIQ